MSKINPRVDFAFKILFGSEENKDILLPFINAVVSLPKPLTALTLLNPYNHKTHSTGKRSILDIKAQDETGKLYHIEMQMNDRIDYDQRALYYWSKIYSQQLSEGQQFTKLKRTISIHLLNFNHFDEPDYHNIYHLLNTKTHRRYSEDLELHFIELKKFNKDFSHLTSALDRWITFLTKAERWERDFIPAELNHDPNIAKAAHALDVLSLDKDEREIYEAQLKWLRDQADILAKTQLDFEARGIQKGIEQGRQEGIQQGIQQGIAQGIAQGIEKIALQLLAQNFSTADIVAITGLSIEMIQALRNEVIKH